MRTVIWALATLSPHPRLGVRSDDNATMVSTLVMVLLALKHMAELADVRACRRFCIAKSVGMSAEPSDSAQPNDLVKSGMSHA